jgi:hypothetical protein
MTEQNKQPPAEAGAGAVAEVFAYAPWIDGRECPTLIDATKPLEIGTKLYTSQTTATQAAVAAAKREAARIVHSFTGLQEATRNHLIERILAAIPAEATAALEKMLENVARKVDTERYCRELDEVDLRAIVTSVIEKGK